MTKEKYIVELAITFVWIGFVSAISFMEAPLKFQAPGITIPLAVSIGRLVFGYLNKVEWICAVIILLGVVFTKGNKKSKLIFLFLIPLSILIFQTIWLLPELDIRAEMLMKGVELSPSNLHSYYMSSEIIKVLCLFSFGISLLNTYNG